MDWNTYKANRPGISVRRDEPVDVRCPKCDATCIFRDLSLVLTSMPPKYRYFCKSCDWTDTAH